MPAAGDLDQLMTPRLLLRRWRPEDEAPMAAINTDPEVTRYLNRVYDPPGVAAFHGRMEKHWAEHGFGFWALERRDPGHAGEFAGFVGVSHAEYIPELAARPEIGWRLATAAWGNGFATEAALAARDDAFGRLGLPELISVIHPDNRNSQRVAEKLGMSIERQVHNPNLGRNVDVWSLRSPS